MSSQQKPNVLDAEARFRQAFERLKAGKPTLLQPGSPVSQNNVAREANCDPSALKKARFPDLVEEIKGYVELRTGDSVAAARKAKEKKVVNRSMQERLDDAIRERDAAQSRLASANLRIVELVQEVQWLRRPEEGGANGS